MKKIIKSILVNNFSINNTFEILFFNIVLLHSWQVKFTLMIKFRFPLDKPGIWQFRQKIWNLRSFGKLGVWYIHFEWIKIFKLEDKLCKLKMFEFLKQIFKIVCLRWVLVLSRGYKKIIYLQFLFRFFFIFKVKFFKLQSQ